MAEKVKCKYCGKELDKRGLKLHELQCSKKFPREKQKGAAHGECDHDFRLLNRKNQHEALAMQDGYKEVCNKCQELR